MLFFDGRYARSRDGRGDCHRKQGACREVGSLCPAGQRLGLHDLAGSDQPLRAAHVEGRVSCLHFGIVRCRRSYGRGKQRLERGRFAEAARAFDPETQKLRSDRIALGKGGEGRFDQGQGGAGSPLGALEPCRARIGGVLEDRRLRAGGKGDVGRLELARGSDGNVP